MTVTEPDIWLIKEEIVSILKTKSTLWETDAHVNGFTDISVGLPAEAEFKGLTYPICFITNDKRLEEDQILGAPTAGEITASKHFFRFRIIFFDQKATGADVEQSLDSLYKIIKETLKENHQLNSVQGVITSFTPDGHSFNFGEFEGQPIDGREIVLKVTVT